jgi:hypothetical protein
MMTLDDLIKIRNNWTTAKYEEVVSLIDRVISLEAELDVLREELDGLYLEKKRSEGFVKVLLRGSKESEETNEATEAHFRELLLQVRRVDDIHGPFAEFGYWREPFPGSRI